MSTMVTKSFTNKDKVYKLIKFKSILIDQDIQIFSKKIKSTHLCYTIWIFLELFCIYHLYKNIKQRHVNFVLLKSRYWWFLLFFWVSISGLRKIGYLISCFCHLVYIHLYILIKKNCNSMNIEIQEIHKK